MKETAKYTKGLADEMEASGVALRDSGAYVHRSFDRAKLEELMVAAKRNIEFERELSVIAVRGRGVLVRIARVSKDGQYAKFVKGLMSLELLNGQKYSCSEFAREAKDWPAMKVRVQQSGEVYLGFRYGTLEDPYAALVWPERGAIRFRDLETHERSNNRHMVISELLLETEDQERLKQMRSELAVMAGQCGGSSAGV